MGVGRGGKEMGVIAERNVSINCPWDYGRAATYLDIRVHHEAKHLSLSNILYYSTICTRADQTRCLLLLNHRHIFCTIWGVYYLDDIDGL